LSKSLAEAVLSRLLVQQRREGLSDERLGDRLGIHQAQITRLRLGRIGAGARVLDGAATEYPELVVEAVREVAGRPLLCRCEGCPGTVGVLDELAGDATGAGVAV